MLHEIVPLHLFVIIIIIIIIIIIVRTIFEKLKKAKEVSYRLYWQSDGNGKELDINDISLL